MPTAFNGVTILALATPVRTGLTTQVNAVIFKMIYVILIWNR